MSDRAYNGWTNYETWLLKLWIDNDQGDQEYWIDRASGVSRDQGSETNARSTLADELETWFKDAQPELQGFWADMLNAALSEVNWYEIAENMLSDVEQDS